MRRAFSLFVVCCWTMLMMFANQRARLGASNQEGAQARIRNAAVQYSRPTCGAESSVRCAMALKVYPARRSKWFYSSPPSILPVKKSLTRFMHHPHGAYLQPAFYAPPVSRIFCPLPRHLSLNQKPPGRILPISTPRPRAFLNRQGGTVSQCHGGVRFPCGASPVTVAHSFASLSPRRKPNSTASVKCTVGLSFIARCLKCARANRPHAFPT